MFNTVRLSSINLCPYVIYRNVTEPVEWQAFFNVSVLLCLCVNFLLVKTVPKLALVKSICLKNQFLMDKNTLFKFGMSVAGKVLSKQNLAIH